MSKIYWKLLFVCLTALLVWISIASSNTDNVNTGHTELTNLSFKAILNWVLLAALPSSLLLGETSVLTQNIAPFPMLWILPLCLYFLSFSLAFSDKLNQDFFKIKRYSTILIIIILLTSIFELKGLALVLIILHLACFFICSYCCNLGLYISRPKAKHLTIFYLAIAFGGALGGMFNALLAPLLFTSLIEVELAYLLFIPLTSWYFCNSCKISKSTLVKLLCFAIGFALLMIAFYLEPEKIYLILITSALFILIYSLSAQYILQSVGFVIVYISFILGSSSSDNLLLRERNFYGVLRVIEKHVNGSQERYLYHGDTIHGAELVQNQNLCKSTTYYHQESAFGQFLTNNKSRFDNVLMIGLGAGSTVCLGAEHQRWELVEIDPGVISVAKNPKYFSFLSKNPLKSYNLVQADGRIHSNQLKKNAYDLIIVDAFSGDSIPTHLLTLEAGLQYEKLLNENGAILVHVSNRYLDLEPVVSNLASALSFESFLSKQPNKKFVRSELYMQARWVLITKRGNKEKLELWKPTKGKKDKVWTDSYSSVFEYLTW